MLCKVEVEINVPDGYEIIGEYRHPEKGEFYLYDLDTSDVRRCINYTSGQYFILRVATPNTIN